MASLVALVASGFISEWSARVLGATAILAIGVLIVVWAVRSRPGCLGWFFLLGFVLMVGGGIFGLIEPELLTSKEESAALERLEKRTEEFVKASGTPTEGTPSLTGRVVTVNIGEREIDESVYIRLPKRLQARSPADVSTVVLIKYTKEVVGQYQGGDDAIQEFAELTIVDLRSGKQYKGETIAGPEPPQVKRGSSSGEGGPVERQAIVDYLVGLPSTAGAGS
jgi:hypothetical protein